MTFGRLCETFCPVAYYHRDLEPDHSFQEFHFSLFQQANLQNLQRRSCERKRKSCDRQGLQDPHPLCVLSFPFLHLLEIILYSFDTVLSYDTVKMNKINESTAMRSAELVLFF